MSDTVRNAEDQSVHRTAALHFVEYLETPPSMASLPWLLCCRCTGTVLNSGISAICQRCSTWSFTNFRSQTACNKPGNETGLLLFFPGTKHFPYGTGDKTKNSGTVPDIPGHLVTMKQDNNDAVNYRCLHCNTARPSK